MGLFEQTIQDGMNHPEYAEGWLEAEEELQRYYASLKLTLLSVPQGASVFLSSGSTVQQLESTFPSVKLRAASPSLVYRDANRPAAEV